MSDTKASPKFKFVSGTCGLMEESETGKIGYYDIFTDGFKAFSGEKLSELLAVERAYSDLRGLISRQGVVTASEAQQIHDDFRERIGLTRHKAAESER